MLIPRKGKGQLEIYKCKLGIHDWVTEHWWETRQKPRRAIFSHKGGRKRAQYYNKYSIGHTTLNNYLRRLNIVRHR